MLELNDENFEQVLQNAEKPVLVDFWAQWCMPCSILTPILEKVAEDYKDRLILAKADLDALPNMAQKLGINQVPTILLFRKGKPISGFIGVKPEPILREILDKMLLGEAIQGYQEYADQHGLRLNQDRKAVETLVSGLLANEKKYKARYCPCRRVTLESPEEEKKICPCQSSREEIEKDGHCYCGLFVK